MLPSELAHFKVQVDDLGRRAEEHAKDPLELRRVKQDAAAIERAIAEAQDQLAIQAAELHALRNRLKRIRARG